MDYPSSPAGQTPHRSCTTQSDSVNTPGSSYADQSPILVTPPDQTPQTSQPLVAEQYRQSFHLPTSYPAHQQTTSYTCTEPLVYAKSHLPSQQLVRHQSWVTSHASSWAGEAPDHAIPVDPATQRALTWDSYSLGGIQPCVSPGHYQQLAFTGQPTFPQPLYPASVEQLQSYVQAESSMSAEETDYYGYPVTSQGVSQTVDLALGGPSNTSARTVRGLAGHQEPRFQPASPTHAGSRTVSAASTAPMTSSTSPRGGQDDAERMQCSATPVSQLTGEELSVHNYPEPASANLDLPLQRAARASSVGAEANDNAGTPYAQLIYQALMSRPRRAMRLQEIYQWFMENTNKGQDGTKGWQNSIRHNLSMNGAFERRQVNGDANDSGDECSSPPGSAHKQAAEWVLLESAVQNGLQSTTRYRNSARRSQNKGSRGRQGRVQRASNRAARAMIAGRSAAQSYSLPLLPGSLRRHDHRLRSHHGRRLGPHYDSLAEQLERASIDEQQRHTMYFTGGGDYQNALQSSYTSPPLLYSPELFMPSAHEAPTVVSDSDDNEVMTPEPSFAAMEPTVLIPGDPNTATPGPTSNPFGNSPSAYYGSQNGPAPRYTMNDVAGVADESQLNCCGWDGNQRSQQQE